MASFKDGAIQSRVLCPEIVDNYITLRNIA